MPGDKSERIDRSVKSEQNQEIYDRALDFAVSALHCWNAVEQTFRDRELSMKVFSALINQLAQERTLMEILPKALWGGSVEVQGIYNDLVHSIKNIITSNLLTPTSPHIFVKATFDNPTSGFVPTTTTTGVNYCIACGQPEDSPVHKYSPVHKP